MAPIIKLALVCGGFVVLTNKGGSRSRRAKPGTTAAPAGTGKMRHGKRYQGVKTNGPRHYRT